MGISIGEVRERLRDVDCTNAYKAYVAQIEGAMKRFSGNPSVLAQAFDVDRHVMGAWIRDNPRLSRAEENYREARIDLAEQKLDIALQAGERWAIELVLRTQGARRGWIEPVAIIDVDKELERLGLNYQRVVSDLSSQMLLEQDGPDETAVEIIEP